MSYVGTLPGAEHQLPLLRFGQPQVDGNVRDCQDLPGGQGGSTLITDLRIPSHENVSPGCPAGSFHCVYVCIVRPLLLPA